MPKFVFGNISVDITPLQKQFMGEVLKLTLSLQPTPAPEETVAAQDQPEASSHHA